MLKSNLQGGGLNIKIIEKKSELAFNTIKSELESWLDPRNTLLNSCDWRLYDSKPMILAEKYLEDESGELRDYKFFCFNGKVEFIQVHYDRFNNHHANYYDKDLNLLDVSSVKNPYDLTQKIVLPDTINKMIEIAEILSNDMPHVRVDFYSVNGKVLLSEMTFNHAGGMNPFKPKKFDEQLGTYFNLPID